MTAGPALYSEGPRVGGACIPHTVSPKFSLLWVPQGIRKSGLGLVFGEIKNAGPHATRCQTEIEGPEAQATAGRGPRGVPTKRPLPGIGGTKNAGIAPRNLSDQNLGPRGMEQRAGWGIPKKRLWPGIWGLTYRASPATSGRELPKKLSSGI